MSFDEWNDKHWRVTKHEDRYYLHGPSNQFVFTLHDFIVLRNRLNQVDVFDNVRWKVESYDTIKNCETGEQLKGIDMFCLAINELYCDNKKLLKEKIDAESKLYKANEELLMHMDYDDIIQDNTDMEFELCAIKKELKEYKENISNIIKSSYCNEKTEFGQKIIKNIASLLEIEL